MNRNIAPALPAELSREPDARDLEQVWNALPQQDPGVSPEETDAAWTELQRRLFESGSGAPGDAAPVGPAVHTDIAPAGRSPLRAGLRTVFRAAATIIVALGATATWYSVPVTHTAEAGERREIVLPDGSQVALNAGSTISYRRGFDFIPGFAAATRRVRLQGEAFFDVTTAVRSFQVEADGAAVRVLGTRFNVRARTPGNVQVDVEEGRVQVSESAGNRSLILGAGEAAAVDATAGELASRAMDPTRMGAWRSGGLVMVDAPLSSILEELSIRFDTEVSLVAGEAATSRLSLYYTSVESVESVVADLATQQGLRYRATDLGWEIF